ncbi:hypothetical protein APHAL10511_005429 [Amanita phalloides]|nr:hypothetical protein APHAL10511_005429 [Amanita phalloides]
MSMSTAESQDALFHEDSSPNTSHLHHVPLELSRASLRLRNPPSYVFVGIYRLCTDRNLYVQVWDKCRHATRRGLVVGAIWTAVTFDIQKKFIELFLSNSPRITGLSTDTVFGFKIPFNVHTYAAIVLVGTQITWMLRFFLSKNLRISRERAWTQTVASRGKGTDFWQPYVEEWENPPKVKSKKEMRLQRFLSSGLGLSAVRVLLLPFDLYPFLGVVIVAWLKALGTAEYLHKPYFQSKKMSQDQIAVFIEERKWDYRVFGFTATLLERIPIIGLMFSISNRVGAAMWAHDLEKIQHFVRLEQEKQK